MKLLNSLTKYIVIKYDSDLFRNKIVGIISNQNEITKFRGNAFLYTLLFEDDVYGTVNKYYSFPFQSYLFNTKEEAIKACLSEEYDYYLVEDFIRLFLTKIEKSEDIYSFIYRQAVQNNPFRTHLDKKEIIPSLELFNSLDMNNVKNKNFAFNIFDTLVRLKEIELLDEEEVIKLLDENYPEYWDIFKIEDTSGDIFNRCLSINEYIKKYNLSPDRVLFKKSRCLNFALYKTIDNSYIVKKVASDDMEKWEMFPVPKDLYLFAAKDTKELFENFKKIVWGKSFENTHFIKQIKNV